MTEEVEEEEEEKSSFFSQMNNFKSHPLLVIYSEYLTIFLKHHHIIFCILKMTFC